VKILLGVSCVSANEIMNWLMEHVCVSDWKLRLLRVSVLLSCLIIFIQTTYQVITFEILYSNVFDRFYTLMFVK
jgi:hypothetical protein